MSRLQAMPERVDGISNLTLAAGSNSSPTARSSPRNSRTDTSTGTPSHEITLGPRKAAQIIVSVNGRLRDVERCFRSTLPIPPSQSQLKAFSAVRRMQQPNSKPSMAGSNLYQGLQAQVCLEFPECRHKAESSRAPGLDVSWHVRDTRIRLP